MQPPEREASARRAEVGSAFGDRAKSARLRAGLTQQQLCDRLGNSLDTSAITRIEAGQREPRLSEALAIAREQEMKALEQEMRARVVEAEAEVPKALADAFRSGRLGVMDYYRMENIKSDTSMRQSISDSGQP